MNNVKKPCVNSYLGASIIQVLKLSAGLYAKCLKILYTVRYHLCTAISIEPKVRQVRISRNVREACLDSEEVDIDAVTL
jgi:hypothetical protein